MVETGAEVGLGDRVEPVPASECGPERELESVEGVDAEVRIGSAMGPRDDRRLALVVSFR